VHCSQKDVKKFGKKPSFGVQGRPVLLILIKTKKPVTSACYDKQHVYIYLQPFSH